VLHQIRFRELSDGDLNRILEEFMTPQIRAELEEHLSVGFAYETPELGRFRANVSRHHRGLYAVFRTINSEAIPLDDMDFPPGVKAAVSQPKGLTLVTGPTGSGKSTTLSALVDHINSTRRGHIITIEDPIEFIHSFKKCVITQREIGQHSPSFSEALKNAMREDPDVIMVGELRDLETVSLALTAAETGIQVLGTLHTNCAPRTIDRVINIFPARRQEQVRSMLAESLRMIISQQLVRNADGTGRVLAAEVLINTHASGAIIRSGHSHKLKSVMQAGKRVGMQSLDSVLMDLLRKEIISGEDAYEHAIERGQFEKYLAREAA
jgi:twitching motility protein PilT